jgi:hypothetical protein
MNFLACFSSRLFIELIMADAGFFKGTSAEQDSRFANKQKKLLKQMKFPANIDVKVRSNTCRQRVLLQRQ